MILQRDGSRPSPEAAGQLGCQYVLQGSVRKSGDRVRITSQLVDGATGSHLWAEMLSYIYMDARNDMERARVQLERAVELNPNDYDNVCAQISIMIRAGNYEGSIACANNAIRLNPFLPDYCLTECGFAEFFAQQYDKALKTFGRILAPELGVKGCIAACYAQLGKDEEARNAAVSCREQAIEEFGGDWNAKSWQRYLDEEVFGLFAQDSDTNDRLRDGLQKAGLAWPTPKSAFASDSNARADNH